MENNCGKTGNYVLGVDVGGTKILIGKMDAACIPFDSKQFRNHTDSQATIISSILGAIEEYLADADQFPSAIGLGLVGHVDTTAGIWKNAINISVREPIAICDMIRKRFGTAAFIDNDVHTATLAEMLFGAGRRTKDFIYINIGTGISAGLVFGGHMIRGASNYAGEIGHMVCGNEQHICKCGRKGCLEPMISGGGIINTARVRLESHPGSSLAAPSTDGTLNAGTVFREAEKGDTLAAEIAEVGIRALEQTTVNLVNFLNPSLVIFGGGALEKEIILGRVKKFVYENALPVVAQGLEEICLSELDPKQTGLIGAGCLAWEGIKSTLTVGRSLGGVQS